MAKRARAPLESSPHPASLAAAFPRAATSRKFSVRLVALVVILVATAPLAAHAGVNSWTTHGPDADVWALAVDPSSPDTLYAGALGAGAFKSTDGGGSWTPINTGLSSPFIRALAIAPTVPSTIYAATANFALSPPNGGVFKSTNGGASWDAVNNGLSGQGGFLSFDALAIDPSNPSTIYAGSLIDFPFLAAFPVFKSTDGGAHWNNASAGLPGRSAYALTIDPTAPATVYAGLANGGFKTTNGGGSWTAMAELTGRSVSAIAIDPSTPTTVYAATNGGVFKSLDGGGAWAAANTGLPSLPFRLAIDRSSPATIYAGTVEDGVFRSEDGGASWTSLSSGLPPFSLVRDLTIDPTNPTKIYAAISATTAGVFDYTILDTLPCVPDPTTLCLNGGRFKVTTRWTTGNGGGGAGLATGLSGDTGYFTFFSASNVEVVVKVVNGCAFNSRYWVFAGGLTDVHVETTVTDTQTGVVKTYLNPQGTAFAPIQDTSAFEGCGAPVIASEADTAAFRANREPAPLPAKIRLPLETGLVPSCTPNDTTLCLNAGRYRVQAQWRTRTGATGEGHVVPLTEDTGAFWFFSANNVEMVVKALNGCGVTSHYWVFAGGLTDVEVTMTVTDVLTSAVKVYTNAQGSPFQPIQDTSAFACP